MRPPFSHGDPADVYDLPVYPGIRLQVLWRQGEGDPWQEMDPEDVSVVFNVEGFTCIRARIRHFTDYVFSWRKKKGDESTIKVSRHWGKSVLVANATNSAAHVIPLPVSFTTGNEATKAVSLTFWETSVSFETGRRTEEILLPVNKPSEIILAGGTTELFFGGGAEEMSLIVCFLPDRKNAASSLSSTQAASTSSRSSPAGRSANSPSGAGNSVAATGRSGVGGSTQTSTAAVPSSGLFVRFGFGQPSAEQNDSAVETEEMVYCMTKVLPGGRRLTLLKETVNRKIKIEKNSRALESYAMMLADFGSAPP